MIRLVGLDLDGTLLATDKSLSEENMEALRRASAKGVHIVPVTGRPLHGLPASVECLDFVRYAVTSNGAVVYDTAAGAAIRERLMTPQKVLELLDAASEEGTICEYFAGGYGYHDDRGWDYLSGRFGGKPLMNYIRRSRRRVDDLRSGILACTSGIENFSSMSRTHEEQDRIRMRIEEIEGVNCIVPCATDLEVISADADKGTALLALAACLGIGRSEVMAMGDGDNDYSMMQTAGLSVAVANADAKILSASDHVTASNDENGVAKAICRFVL